MPSILCRHGGTSHHHDGVDAVRRCQAAPVPVYSTPTPAPARPHAPHGDPRRPEVIHVNEPPTDAQVSYLVKLGARRSDVQDLTRLQASRMIDRYKKEREQNVTAPAPARNGDSIKVPVALLESVKDGYYATQPDSDTPLLFMRVSRPKKGPLKGFLKVQTQHGDDLIDRVSIAPSGRVWFPNRPGKYSKDLIESHLLLVVVDQFGAALTYGRHIGKCCICGKKLTDEHSRWYGIGPDCGPRFPHIYARVEEQFGAYYPGAIPEPLAG